MKNKGLHTSRRVIPLGSHKDEPAPPASAAPKDQTLSTPAPSEERKDGPASPDDHPKMRARRLVTTKGESGVRYPLSLAIDETLLGRLEQSMSVLPAATRRQYRRALTTAFVSYLAEHGMKSVTYAPQNPSRHRIDVRLPKELVAKASKKERLYPLEPDSLVLSRYLSGHFAAYIESILAK